VLTCEIDFACESFLYRKHIGTVSTRNALRNDAL
jgi:hypothetical protein